MDIEIMKKNGTPFLLSSIGFEIKDFIVSSIQMEEYSETIEGRHGKVNYGADYRERTITAPFIFKPKELHEFSHARDELFEKLTEVDGYYIRELRRAKKKEYAFVEPVATQLPKLEAQHENRYVNGKQYFVRLSDIVILDQKVNYAEGTLQFTTIELPFAETIYSTLEIDSSKFSAIVEKYGTADNINIDYTTYRPTTATFQIWNAGNVTVRPENMQLKLMFRGINITSSMTIENVTTGEKMMINKTMTSTLIIEGLTVKQGTLNILRDTNRNFISLAPGLNEIKVTGATYTSVDVDFKFYYK